LAVDLPVSLIDHLDRNPDKQLLRGTVGHVVGWEYDEDERTEERSAGRSDRR